MIRHTAVIHSSDPYFHSEEFDEVEGLREFVKYLQMFCQFTRITTMTPTRIIAETATPSRRTIAIDAYEGPENEMELLHEIAGWYIRAQNNPVFTIIKDPEMIELAAGIPRGEICAN